MTGQETNHGLKKLTPINPGRGRFQEGSPYDDVSRGGAAAQNCAAIAWLFL